MNVKISLSQRSAKLIISAIAFVLFAVPQISIYLTHASFLTLANESIAYRYFLASRLEAGEGGDVWLPQGQMTSLIQRGIYRIVDQSLNVWDRMDAFGLLYGFAVVIAFGAVLAALFLSRTFTARDMFLVAATPVSIIYLLATNLNYTTRPDYQHLNMVLVAAAVALFIYFSRNPHKRLSAGGLVIAGAFVGLCIANKVSLIVIAAAAISPLLVDAIQARDWRGLLTLVSITTVVAMAAAVTALLTLYGFSWRAAKLAFGNILAFALNPGENEPWFLRKLIAITWESHYLQATLVAIVFIALIAIIRPALAMVLFVAAAIFIAFIWYRPAGSTAFDAGCAMVAITAMAISLLPEQYLVGRRAIGIATLLALGMVNFPSDLMPWLRSTREKQAARAEFLHDAEEAGHPIIAVIPDDSWASYGPLPAILKGFSVFPTWHIPPERTLPLRVALTYRTTYGDPAPDEPYPANATILWEDRPGRMRLTEIYPALLDATQSRNCRVTDSEGFLWLCLPSVIN